MDTPAGMARKPATSARMYDYYLGGGHNFPADRAAADMVIAQFPTVPVAARANRAFLRRAVAHIAWAGIRRFLDLGSGIPTEGNVHEITRDVAPESLVVYVDIDPVAVAESLEILDDNDRATAICGDLRDIDKVLGHKQVTALLDFDRPVAVLLAAALPFVPDDETAYGVVGRLVDMMAPGSYLALSHVATEAIPRDQGDVKVATGVYRQWTTTAVKPRSRDEVRRFFAGTGLIEPGVVWISEWRPDPAGSDQIAVADGVADDPVRSGTWGAVGRKATS